MMPATYPAGRESPVIAWVENESGGPVRVNGSLVAEGQRSIQVLRGAGSGFLASTNPAGELVYKPELQTLAASRTIQLDQAAWTVVQPGVLSGNISWPERSRISLNGNITIPAGSTLTVGAGSVVSLGAGVNILLNGEMTINGTVDEPVVFAPAASNQPWGGFYLTNSTSKLQANGTIFTGSGASPGGVPSHRPEQCLFFMQNHSQFNLTNCAAISLAGQFGHAVDSGQPWNSVSIVRSLIQRCTTGGEWNGTALHLLQSALLETPYMTDVFNDGDEDGIYFTTGQYLVEDSLVGWTRDDGIDSGSGGTGSVTVRNTWIESTYHEAFAWSGGGRTTTNLHTVCLNCGQGIECGWSTTAMSPNDFVDDCLSTANLIGTRFGDNYDWTYTGFLRVTNSLLLNNYRDIWGCNWQDWTYRTNAMDIQGNLLTRPNPRHENNQVWDPAKDGWRLASFMTTPADAPVGVGLAVWSDQFGLGALTSSVPVRLSCFTTNTVSVSYRLETAEQVLATGTVEFAPGETVKKCQLLTQPVAGLRIARLVLSNPVNAQLTGKSVAWFVSGSTAVSSTLISTGATWKYLDTGADAGTEWRNVAFDDTSWKSGPAELGYGDTKDGRPEATIIGYGGVDANKFITYYFRHAFEVSNPAEYGGLVVRLKRDDGGLVYLNGKNVFRSNMPDEPVNYLTRAASTASDDGTSFFSTNVPATLLVAGTNVMAVEIHQDVPTSSDVSFDLQLEGSGALRLNPVRFGQDWVLVWDEPQAVLEAAIDLAGPWSSLASSSPAPVENGVPQKFYRLRKP
jgi:hypothetical protein